jgi:LPPG:FO 2-phospho-L-lactate transferase
MPSTSRVVVLAGGTGGAKLARGMLDVVGHSHLSVIANTGDDIEIYGAHVSPDPDLIGFWLAGEIDERGWGLRGDTFEVMDALRALGRDVWFNLGDRDLAWCMERTHMESSGMRHTETQRELCARIGVDAAVLPMSDRPFRTFVDGRPLQEFLIRLGGAGPIGEVGFVGPAGDATPPPPSPEVLAALERADAVVIGPSNPVISIWPILAVLATALAGLRAPVVAVSPIVGGNVVKGPTQACLKAFGHACTAGGVHAFYEQLAPGLIGGILSDEPAPDPSSGLAWHTADTRMDTPDGRQRVARDTLALVRSLTG